MLKKLSLLLLIHVFGLGLAAQNSTENTFYDSTFSWTFEIPEGFFTVTPEEWAVIQNRGQEAFEESLDGEIVEPANTILVVKKNQFNYIEAN